MSTGRVIVVGVDGSENNRPAIGWAAKRAALERVPLLLMHAVQRPVSGGFTAPDLSAYRAIPDSVTEMLEGFAADVRKIAPHVDVSTNVVVNAPAVELIERSKTAEMIVLGNRGRGGFSGLLLGSVGIHVSAHAHCPVVVVRSHAQEQTSPECDLVSRGQVVAGVDGSGLAEGALRFAFEEAYLRGTGITAVHVSPEPAVNTFADTPPLGYEVHGSMVEHRQRELAEALSGWRDKFPDVPVYPLVLEGSPGKELVRLSHGAELLVVGARGRGGFRGLLLGSVSQAAIHHAHCPVMVACAREASEQ